MDISTAIDNITTLVRTAAAGITPPIIDVQRGDPVPTGRCVRVWYGGGAESEKFETGTLAARLFAETVVVTCYWPMPGSDTPQAASRDREIVSLSSAIRSTILGHATLSGAVTDLDISPGAPDFGVYNGTPYRAMVFEITLEFSEYTRTA